MNRQVIIALGLGYGDEGKGSIVDYLCRITDAYLVVRFNGGPQAAHNVVLIDGRHHTFAQFGSGMLVPGVHTHLAATMLVNPLNLMREADHLIDLGISDVLERLTLSVDAPMITPFQIAANRLRELARGDNRHGSCGQGIGETMNDMVELGLPQPTLGDLLNPAVLREKLIIIRQHKLNQMEPLRASWPNLPVTQQQLRLLDDPAAVDICLERYAEIVPDLQLVKSDWLSQTLQQPGTVIFEGAQGTLLDEWRGFHPYTTWSTTTTANADQLLAEANYDGTVLKLGLLRAYTSRHGAGPLVTEDADLSLHLNERHNDNNTWQQAFRFGYFDAVAHRYGVEVNSQIDALAISHLDQLANLPTWQVCRRYQLKHQIDDAGQYLEFDADGLVQRIKPGPFTDLDYQQRLTDLLADCQPIYETIDSREINDYLEWIQTELSVPIGLISVGPIAADKTLTPDGLAVGGFLFISTFMIFDFIP